MEAVDSTHNMASVDDLTGLPTPDMITLFFKCHKSTTLLSVLPTKPLPEIKALLLAALQARNITTVPNSTTPLPEDSEDFEFGILADKKDPAKGWIPMETKEQESTGAKGVRKKAVGPKNGSTDTPLAVGLIDGSWVAYRVKAVEKEKRQLDEDADLEGAILDIEIDEDPGWDVVLPSFDDEAE